MGKNSSIEFQDRVIKAIEVNKYKFEFISIPKYWKEDITFKCRNCGHTEKRKSASFFKGESYKYIKRCKGCEIVNHKKESYTINEARDMFNKSGFTLIDNVYINCKVKMKYYCPTCDDEHFITLDNLRQGKGCLVHSMYTLTEERIKNKVKQLGFKLIKINREDMSIVTIVLELECKNKHRFTINWSSIRNKEEYSCMVCRGYKDSKYGKSQKMHQMEVEDYCKKEKLDYKFIKAYDRVYPKNKAVWFILECKKHGKFEVEKSSFMKRYFQRCPICTKSASKGEMRISETLNKYNISFIRECSFSDCRNKLPLPFDFYLNEHKIMIEFQGEEHYAPIKFFGGENKFKSRQINDKIKRDYCKNKKEHKLIEIPYWNFNDIDEIVKEAIK